MTNALELIVDGKNTVGEGPSWDEYNQRLYWVDIIEKKLYIYYPRDDHYKSVTFEQFIGAVAPMNSKEVVLAMHYGLYTFNMNTQQLTFISNPEKHKPNNRFNDGKCDPSGRFWAGTMDLNAKENQGTLYCLDVNRMVKKMYGPTTVSNGMAWHPRDNKMYFIDSPTRKIVAFDFELKSGNIGNPKVVVDMANHEGVPDGMTIDEEGNLWVAHWDGSKVSRWNPDNGKLMDEIPVPCSRVTSCTFGGKNLDELYITTARRGISEEVLEKEPHAGGVFRLRTNVKGSPTYSYKG